MNFIKNRSFLYIGIALAMALSSISQSDAQEKITIGVLAPLTGPYTFEAESQRDFAHLVAKEIKAT